MNNDFLPVSAISAELLSLTGDAGPGRRRLIELGASARLPLTKPGREWGCSRADLAAVAKALGLSLKQ
jgi:hypothetical protein